MDQITKYNFGLEKCLSLSSSAIFLMGPLCRIIMLFCFQFSSVSEPLLSLTSHLPHVLDRVDNTKRELFRFLHVF